MKQQYCNSFYKLERSPTLEVDIKGVKIGGKNDIIVQSMGIVSSLESGRASMEAIGIIEAGGQMVRYTAASVAEAKGVGEIASTLRERGYRQPVIADVHFNPKAALEAARVCDKVRINPGNFTDKKDALSKELTDSEYNIELDKIEAALAELIDICKERGTALRIGVNHGSLSERIMSRYGDTPEGMVASAMEFLRICHKLNFNQVVVSMKSSSTPVMVRAYRQLALAMAKEQLAYPLHLGVTEAGEGSDGRIRSAVGIGALLGDGLGDTIRVSLTEPPENEIVVARQLLAHFDCKRDHAPITERDSSHYSPYSYQKRESIKVGKIGGANPPAIIGYDLSEADMNYVTITNSTLTDDYIQNIKSREDIVIVVESNNSNYTADMRIAILALRSAGVKLPIAVKFTYRDETISSLRVKASADAGALFIDNLADALWVECQGVDKSNINDLGLAILQAADARITRAEYISCPGCGRTMFDIQSRVKQVKEQTKELSSLKIAVMGCIVNGPGEMAGADYGYVGAGRGRVVLYKAGEPVSKPMDEQLAVDALIELIKDSGDWR